MTRLRQARSQPLHPLAGQGLWAEPYVQLYSPDPVLGETFGPGSS